MEPKRFSSALHYPKKISFVLVFSFLVILNVVAFFVFHSNSFVDELFFDAVLIWSVWAHNREVEKLDTNISNKKIAPVEDERTVLLRKKYVRISLFCSFIIVLATVSTMYFLNKELNPENILLLLCVLLLGGFTLSSYLAKR